ncbi:MAG: Xaa-Pro peptidase family protein [Peptococcaceae bacterium]|nr:Xaa-Pro peptidase family protein [Peptococcaceae bacterium]
MSNGKGIVVINNKESGDGRQGVLTQRFERVRRAMEREGVEALLVCSPENIFYLSGFAGSAGILFVDQEHACLFVDFRYVEQAKTQAVPCEIVELASERGELAVGFLREKGWLKGAPQTRLSMGLEEDFLSWRLYEDYGEWLSECEPVGISQMLARLRQVKDCWELELMKQAAALTDRGFAYILGQIQPGKTEKEVALALEVALRAWGAEGCSFDFIAASGPRSSMPHALASERVLSRGDLLTLDFGVKLNGYCSDMTRTVCLGEPTARQREIYDIVLRAQETGLKALIAGKTGREVDACARAVIAEAGYESHFGHGLGHALGIVVHEEPRLNTRDETVLLPGMVVTVEPGIYVPGWGGVRIEDMAVVTEKEAEVLTRAPKQFIII